MNMDNQISQAFDLDIVFILEPLDHFMHPDTVLLEVVLLDFLESDLGGLLGLDFLELFLFFHEQLNQFL